MDKVIGTSVVLVILLVALLAMFFAWRKRVALQSHYAITPAGVVVAEQAKDATEFSVLYVATTLASEPLERIMLPGLSFRAQAQVLISPVGLSIKPAGEKTSFIPADQLIQIHRSQVAIDRVVEKGGLTAISWNAFDSVAQSPIELTSYFRIASPQQRIDFDNALIASFPTVSASSKEATS